MVRGLCRMALKQQFRTIEVTGQENISEDAGILTVAWHTNALIDSSTIFVTQPKRLVFGARHDLLTRPLIGHIASISGTQPVIRQAERARGGASGWGMVVSVPRVQGAQTTPCNGVGDGDHDFFGNTGDVIAAKIHRPVPQVVAVLGKQSSPISLKRVPPGDNKCAVD